MLQPFVGVSDPALKGNVTPEKLFRLFDLPNAQPRGFVNLMLKKNRHEYNLRFKIADF